MAAGRGSGRWPGAAWAMALACLGCLALAAARPGAVRAQSGADPAMDLSAVAGHGGWVRSGTWAPLSITAASRRDGVVGTLTVQMGGARDLVYRQPLVLPAGGRREVQIPVLIEGDAAIAVTVADAAGNRLAAARVEPQPLDETTVLAATLSGDPGAFTALSAARPAAGVGVAVVPLDPIAFPENPLLLESFDLMVLARLDTAVLRQAQRRALEMWVRGGGTLVVAGGPEWRRVLAGVPAALHPVQVRDARPEPAPAELAAWAPPPAGEVTAATGPLAPGAAAVVGPAASPLVSVLPAGRGRVVYLAADPTLEPLASWPELQAFWERLLVLVPLKNQVPRGDLLPLGRTLGTRSPSGAGGVVERAATLGLPPAGAALGFLAVYVFLAGPAAWWLLRRIGRREWLWAVAPAVALVSVAGVYAGEFSRGGQAITHLIGVYELVPGARAATARTYVGVYAPTMDELRGSLAAGVLVSPLPFDPAAAGAAAPDGEAPGADGGSPEADGEAPGADGGSPETDGGSPGADGGSPGADGGSPGADGGGPEADGGGSGADGAAAGGGEPLVVTPGLEPAVRLANLGMYRMGGFTAEHVADLGGTVEFDLTYRDGAVVGRIRNGTGQVLRRATAYTWGAFQEFLDLAPGQTVDVRIPLGDPGRPATGYYMAADRLPLRLLETEQQRLVLELMLGGGREFDAPPFTFFAWADQPPALPGGVAELGRAVVQLSLVYARPMPAVDFARPEVPPGLVRPRLLASTSGSQVLNPGPLPDFSIPAGRVVLSFLPPPLDPSAVGGVQLHLNLSGAGVARGDVTVRVRNWQTGAWDEHPAGPTLDLPDWRPYLGPGGEVQVEIAAGAGVSLTVPTLSVRGVSS